MTKRKYWQNAEWLREKYWDEMLSTTQMGELAGCTAAAVYYWMKKLEVPIRSHKEAAKIAFDPTTERGKHWYRDKSEVIKVAWERGVYGEAWKKKQRAALAKIYDSSTSEGRQLRNRISKSVEEAWERGCYEGTFTEERARKQAERVRAAHARGVYSGASDALKRAHANGVYDGVYQSPTSIEIAVSDALDKLDIAHETQFRPEGCSKIYDELVYPNILIEVQGDYWHNLPGARERDIEKAMWAQEHGYHLIEMWEHEINSIGAMKLVVERVLPMIC